MNSYVKMATGFMLSSAFSIALHAHALADTVFVTGDCDRPYSPYGRFYQHTDFGGRDYVVGPNCRTKYIANLDTFVLYTNIGPNTLLELNDRVSSAEANAEGMLVLHQHSNQRGRFIVLGVGRYRSLKPYDFNDTASSAAWYPGSEAPFNENFYRRVGEPHVFWYGKDFTCRVTGPDQMKRLGGFGRVNIVSDNIAIPGARIDVDCQG